MSNQQGNDNQHQPAPEAPSFAHYSEEHDGFFINSPHDSSRFVFLDTEDAVAFARWVMAGQVVEGLS